MSKKKIQEVDVKSTGNKELDKMIAKVKKAKENGEKSVVVFTTKRSHHKKNLQPNGFGASDLKPKFYEAYKHMLLNYDVKTHPLNISELAIEWIVDLKK
jgi:hypothetical protein